MLDDRITVDTPEGVRLELTLAGLGTRILAAAIDAVVQGALLAAVVFGAVAIGSSVTADLGFLFLGGISIAVAVILIAYPVSFETLNGGRTPGKAALGIRVIRASGAPVGFWSSMIRNLFRLVDFLPTGYAVGAFAILATDGNQRLGDMAASTMVIRDRIPTRVPVADLGPAPGWDVSSVTRDEVVLVRRFFDRSRSLPLDRRAQLAEQIASRLRPKVGGVEQAISDEEFLRRMLGQKLGR